MEYKTPRFFNCRAETLALLSACICMRTENFSNAFEVARLYFEKGGEQPTFENNSLSPVERLAMSALLEDMSTAVEAFKKICEKNAVMRSLKRDNGESETAPRLLDADSLSPEEVDDAISRWN